MTGPPHRAAPRSRAGEREGTVRSGAGAKRAGRCTACRRRSRHTPGRTGAGRASTSRSIEEIHAELGGTYGARRITRVLARKGVEVAHCTVERLMAGLGLEGVIRGRRCRTTVPEPSATCPPDPVDRDFIASRRALAEVVGWQVANRMRSKLPLNALETLRAEPGANPAVRLKQDHRALRNSLQLTFSP
ncbi:IS3 family transposase [Streptomyces sp. NPDC002526]